MMKVIQHTAATAPPGSTSGVTFSFAQPTLARSLIIVMEDNISLASILSITDNSPAGTSLYSPVAKATSPETTEIWYAANSNGSATSFTLNFNTAVRPLMWIFEVQVMNSSSPLTQSAVTNNGASTLTPTGPSVTTKDPLEFIVNVMIVGASITSVNAPWTLGDITSGDASSYLITTYQGTGTFAPTYNVTASGGFGSVTAAFREAPHSIDLRKTMVISDYYEG